MRRRRRLWLIAAIVLFAICGWLLLHDETPDEPAKQVEIPHRMREKERQRMVSRRTLPILPPVQTATAAPPAPPRPRDPVLAALASGHGKVAIVIEANAIRYSPIGQLLIDCLASLPGGNPIQQAKDQLGIDPLQDLDRVAITDDGVILSGNFKNEKWDQLLQQHADDFSTDTQPYGDKGTVYTMTPTGQLPDGGTPTGETFASWNNQLLFLGKSPGAAQAAIDRIEGRADAEPAISEDQTYGEIYGNLSPQALAEMIPPDQQDLRNQLLQTAQKVQLHVDAMNDVGVSLTLKGDDADKVTDLGKSAAGALSLARLYAKSQGDDDLASLLDYAKVDPNGSSFDLDLALPMSWFEKELAWCRDPKLRAQHFGLDAGE